MMIQLTNGAWIAVDKIISVGTSNDPDGKNRTFIWTVGDGHYWSDETPVHFIQRLSLTTDKPFVHSR